MARSFDGSADYLEATSAPVTALPLTLATWFRSNSNTVAQALLCVGTNGGNGRVQIQYDGSAANDPVGAVSATSGGTLVASTYNTGGVTSSTWYHCAGVFSSTTSRTVYFNGTASAASTTANDPSASGWNRVVNGARRNSAGIGGFLNGATAESAIWSTDLSADEIARLAAGYSPLLVRPQSLVFYSPLHGRNGAAGDEEDWVGGRTLAQTSSPALADHPRIIYPRRRTQIFVPAAGGAITIDGSVGNAVAVGIAGTPGVSIEISGSVGNAVAAGIAGVPGVSIDISGSVGNAVAAGITGDASVGSDISISGNVGNAVAAGITGSLSLDIVVPGVVGNAVAAGISGTIVLDTTINGAVGNAVAAGVTGNASISGASAVRIKAGSWIRYTILS